MIDTPRGRRRTNYTPDFLVLTSTGAKVIQVKPLSTANDLIRSAPHRWKLHQGRPVDAAAKDHFASIGLPHLVVTSADINAVLISNVGILKAASTAVDSPELARLRGRCVALLQKHAVLSIHSAMEMLRISDATSILQLISDGRIHCDISHSRIAVSEEAWISISERDLRDYLDAKRAIQLPSSCESIQHFTAKETIRIADRIAQLDGHKEAKVHARTLQRWAALRKDG